MQLVLFIIVGVFLSLLPGEFGHYPFGGASFAVSVTDILLFLALIFFFIWKVGIKKDLAVITGIKLLSLFWGIGVLSLCWSGIFGGGLYLLRFIMYSLSFWVGSELIEKNITKLSAVLNLFICVSVGLCLLGFLQLVVHPDLEGLTEFGFDPHKGRLVSTFLDPNLLGSFLNIAVVFCLYMWRREGKKMFFYYLVILGLAIILTFSRSAYLFLLSTFLLFGIFKYKQILYLFLILMVCFYFLVPRFSERLRGAALIDKSANERFESWNKAQQIFLQNPVSGVGFNNYRLALERNNFIKPYSTDGGHSGAGVDSSLLFVLATTGILGGVAYLYWWFWIFKNRYNKGLTFFVRCLIIGLFLNSQFVNSLFFAPVMFVTFFILGACSKEAE